MAPQLTGRKGCPRPATEIVQGPCTQPFARARFAGEEHGGLALRQQGELALQHSQRPGASPTSCASPTVSVHACCHSPALGALLPEQPLPDPGAYLGLPQGRDEKVRGPVVEPVRPLVQVHGLQDRHEWRACRLRPEPRQEVFGPLPGRRQDWEDQVRTGFHTRRLHWGAGLRRQPTW